MNVPKNIIDLLKQQVALRWNKATTQTYLTKDGYVDYQIRPSLDIQIKPSPDSDPVDLGFNYTFISFDNNQLKIKLNFENPQYISSQGLDKDQVMVTFWNNVGLVSQNGLPVPKGTTLQKSIICQVEDFLNKKILQIATQFAIAVVVIIVAGLLIALIFNFDENPFWSLFNTWQMIAHLSLINLNSPGLFKLFLQKQLDFLLIRIPSWQKFLYRISKINMADEHSFNPVFEINGCKSMLLFINFGLPMVIFGGLIVILPFSWIADNIISVPDLTSRVGGRKQAFKKTMFLKTINAIVRCIMIGFLDLTIFMILNADSVKQNFKINAFGKFNATLVVFSALLIGLLFLFICIQAILLEIKHKKKAIEGNIFQMKIIDAFTTMIGSFTTIFVGLSTNHPIRSSIFQIFFILRRLVFALTIIYLQSAPVVQLFITLMGSLATIVSYGQFMPFEGKYNTILELLNETSFMFTLVMQVAFTDMVVVIETRNQVAWFLIVFFLIILFNNICFGLYSFWFCYNSRVKLVTVQLDKKKGDIDTTKIVSLGKLGNKIAQTPSIQNNMELVDPEVGIQSSNLYYNPYNSVPFQKRRMYFLGQNCMEDRSYDNSFTDMNDTKLLKPHLHGQNQTDNNMFGNNYINMNYEDQTNSLRNLLTPDLNDLEIDILSQRTPRLKIEKHVENKQSQMQLQEQYEEEKAKMEEKLFEQLIKELDEDEKKLPKKVVQNHRKENSSDFGKINLHISQEGFTHRIPTQLNQQTPSILEATNRHQVSYYRQQPVNLESTHVLNNYRTIQEDLNDDDFEKRYKSQKEDLNRQVTGLQLQKSIPNETQQRRWGHKKMASIASISNMNNQNLINMTRFERHQKNKVQGQQKYPVSLSPTRKPRIENSFALSLDSDQERNKGGIQKQTTRKRSPSKASPPRLQKFSVQEEVLSQKGKTKELSSRNEQDGLDVLSIDDEDLEYE